MKGNIFFCQTKTQLQKPNPKCQFFFLLLVDSLLLYFFFCGNAANTFRKSVHILSSIILF